jgi:hypothetical protein
MALLLFILALMAIGLVVSVVRQARSDLNKPSNPMLLVPVSLVRAHNLSASKLGRGKIGARLNGWMRIGILVSIVWIPCAPFVVGYYAEQKADQSQELMAGGGTPLVGELYYRLLDLREYESNGEIYTAADQSVALWALMWLAVLALETVGPFFAACGLAYFAKWSIGWVHAGFKPSDI